MNENLLVGVLGYRDSGKSTTWNTLFNAGHDIRTSRVYQHRLLLTGKEYVEVFVVSGSPEERQRYVGEIVRGRPRIVLCSMQYRADVTDTIDYFVENDYFLYVHWLNPGYNDPTRMSDQLGIVQHILDQNSLVGIRDGRVDPEERVGEMRTFIRSWAESRGLMVRQ